MHLHRYGQMTLGEFTRANDLNLLLGLEITGMKDVYFLPFEKRYEILNLMDAATYSSFREKALERAGLERKLNITAKNSGVELSVTIEAKR